MSAGVKILKAANHLFPLPVHPFNMQLDGKKSYAMWQYEKGDVTIQNYLRYATMDEMFKDKVVLDIGCGAGGKSLYYASHGAKKVVGLEILEKYRDEAYALAKELGIDNFEFVAADAAHTPFEDNSFDCIIMNDAMEHVARPEAVLDEMQRILTPGGKLYINFPPYNHPFGAHLSDAVAIPWVHVFFSDKTLIEGYKDLVKDKPDGADRIKFRISTDENGNEYFSYINKMTIKRFAKIKENVNLKTVHYEEIPLRPFLKPLCKGAGREFFVKMVVCIFEKE